MSERIRELGIGGALAIGVLYVVFQFVIELGVYTPRARPMDPRQAGTIEQVKWATRGIIIDKSPEVHREIANALRSLAVVIQSMNDSVRRLEQDIRDHDREARRRGG